MVVVVVVVVVVVGSWQLLLAVVVVSCVVIIRSAGIHRGPGQLSYKPSVIAAFLCETLFSRVISVFTT